MKHFITLKDIPAADLWKIVNDAKKSMTPDQIAAGQLLAKELFAMLEKQKFEDPADNPINVRLD